MTKVFNTNARLINFVAFLQTFLFLHIPLGVVALKHRQLRDSFNTILARTIATYADVILGTAAAHTHTNEFRIIYSDQS